MANNITVTPLENFDPDGTCFACGPDNPAGLHMTFHTNGDTVFSQLTAPRQLCGWQNMLHGGIISTILDEVMSWTAHHLIQKLILTRSITVDFKRPVYAQSELRAEGWIDAIVSDHDARLKARLLNAKEKICARATGSFALLTPKVARRMGLIDEAIIAKFETFFQTASQR